MAQSNRSPSKASLEKSIEFSQRCAPIAFGHTIPIFHEFTKDGKEMAASFGSGVLAQIGGKPFLLTAGHLLDVIVQSQHVIGLSTGEPGTLGVQLHYDKAVSNIPPGTKRPDDDYLDVGAFLLTQEVAARLGKRFLPENALDPGDNELAGNQYLIGGFPASRKNQSFDGTTAQARFFSYGTSLYRLSRGEPKRFVPEDEVLIDYSKGNNLSAHFEKRTSPLPQGMSGCGIWRTYSAAKPVDGWTPDEMRLVGVTHTHCRLLAIIRGTRIGVFLEMIRQHFA